MVTRRQEKEKRNKIKREKIEGIARSRSIGQSMKDDGRWYRKPNRISYTKREQKQLSKL